MALYRDIFDVFLTKRLDARGIQLDLHSEQMQAALLPLGFYLMANHITEIQADTAAVVISEALIAIKPGLSPYDFLKSIEANSGLLSEQESGIYAFAHKTFQEYLTAVYWTEHPDIDQPTVHVTEDWWHESIRLYCAQNDASAVIAACLDAEPPDANLLALAIDCEEEAKSVQDQAIRGRLQQLLKEGLEADDMTLRHRIAEAYLTRRLRNLTHLTDDRYIDNSLITYAEYQLFLDEKAFAGEYPQPDHWLEPRFPTGQGGDPVLGVRSSDAIEFCGSSPLNGRSVK